MCDIPNEVAMDGNTAEIPAMDTLEAEKVDALQSEPSIEDAVQGSTVAGASQASQSPSSGEQGSCRKEDGQYQGLLNRTGHSKLRGGAESEGAAKELKIDRCMEYGQSRIIDWDHVAEVKEDLLANPPDGRLQLLVWDDKGMGLLRRNSINVIGYSACPV